MNGCSPALTLARLLNDQLDGDEYASVVEHVETCADCQARLKALTEAESLLGDWSSLERAPGDSSSTVDGSVVQSAVGSSLQARSSKATFGARAGAVGDAGVLPDVPDYEVLAELGHGGMGVVYRARQRRLSRLVALKMIRAGSLAKPEDLARFRVEAEAIAKLRHPNIIQIYDIGEIGGLPFVALELLEGGSLDDSLAGTPQPAEVAATTAATLSRAVHAAHEAGIVHRDLKPSNVLFTTDGTPKITDFGLAKRLQEDGQTETGQVLGSPSYIPPEQAQGRSKDVGPTADVYALGAILYEMLTGRPPFHGTTPLDTVMQVLHDEPLPPSRLVPQIPRDLETICLKCLAKDPHRRYQTALALAEDIERYLASEPIRARRTPLWEQGLKWARRRPTTSSLGAAGLLVAVIVVGAAWQFHRVRLAEARARGIDLAAQRSSIEVTLGQAGDEFRAGGTPVEGLSFVLAKIEAEPALSDLRTVAASLLEQARSRRDDQDVREAIREFHRLSYDARFYDIKLTDLGLFDTVAKTRKIASDALEIFAARGQPDEHWSMASLPPSLTKQERADVVQGCYEMLLVLSGAVAQPLPGESQPEQARRALKILEDAQALHPEGSRNSPAARRLPPAGRPGRPRQRRTCHRPGHRAQGSPRSSPDGPRVLQARVAQRSAVPF